ncbi:MAG: outer membrane lipoprotein carrier protein LolA [Desulfovibrio sp.]|jgi:outer membrane lipoprotein-sorting protein|nr:outer membrane lipoprotein carrier protein LolA [Desulfovibrio sp.]
MARILLFLVFLLLPAALCRAGEAEDLDRALVRLKSMTENIRTLSCSFRQSTDIPIFSEPEVSEGALRFRKPDALAWEYFSPMREGFVLNGRKGFRWEDDKSRRKPFVTGEDPLAGLVAGQLLVWMDFDRARIESRYEIVLESESPLTLTLLPRGPELRSVLGSLQISFDGRGAARRVVLNESRGGRTTLDFNEVILNRPIFDAEFD